MPRLSLTLATVSAAFGGIISPIFAQERPGNLDPIIRCPVAASDGTEIIGGREVQYLSSESVRYPESHWESRISGSWDTLNKSILGTAGVNVHNDRQTPDTIPENARVIAIDIRRVNGKLAYHYFSNGTAFHPIENWSSTKAHAMFLAGLEIRARSDGKVGLNSTVGRVNVGRYITEVARISDNGIAGWFKTIMGPSTMSKYWNQWLRKTTYDYYFNKPTISEEFGGRYGAPPENIGGTMAIFTSPGNEKVRIRRQETFVGNNALSPLSVAESFKRIFVNRSDVRTMPIRLVPQIAGHAVTLTDDDLKTLFYGDTSKSAYGGLLLGGTKAPIVKALGGRRQA